MSDHQILCNYDVMGLPIRHDEPIYICRLPGGRVSFGVAYASADMTPEMAIRAAYALLHFALTDPREDE